MSESIVDVVFQRRTPPALRRSTLATIIAVAAHAGVLVWALNLPPKPAQLAKPKEYLVEIEKPKPPPPPLPKPPDPPQPTPTPAPEPARPQPVVKAPTTPPPPAQAAKIIAAEPDPTAPVDLSDAFVTGDADKFAGGVTAATGTNDKAVHDTDTDPNAKPAVPAPKPKPKGPDHSHSVSLDEDNWSCSWPKAADEEQIDEQAVIIKVSVDEKGRVNSANIVLDPGHGFGQAAVTCALKTRFIPALDPQGKAIASLSPPIRVRFTR